MNNNHILTAIGVVVLAAVGFLLYRGVTDAAVAPPIPTPTQAPAPAAPWPDVQLSNDPVPFGIVTPGDGEAPRPDQVVEVSMRGWVASNQAAFGTGRPERFVLSNSTMIAGVTEALSKMKPGEVRLIKLPPVLAYGQTGKPPIVPRDAEVMVEVTLHSVTDAVDAPEAPPEASADVEVEGVKTAVLVEGDGPMPKAGDKVSIHFTVFLEDGTRLDSTHDRHSPVTITVAQGQVFEGLDRVLPAMKVGEKRKVVLPPELGAGAEGRGAIPPNSTLIIELELVSIG